jgi:hypothetical protein
MPYDVLLPCWLAVYAWVIIGVGLVLLILILGLHLGLEAGWTMTDG